MNKDLKAFVPMTREEMIARGWDAIDILIVSGDAYVDHPSFGPPLIARVLLDAGYRVGIVAQPDWRNPESLKTFGRPLLGAGVASGNMDSMVKLYSAGRRLRHEDLYSPGGQAGLCPPHASVVYAQLVKAAFPALPVILGGVEASLRRIGHYDYWQDKMRPSVLVDSKADLLCYGMGEKTMLEIFSRIKNQQSLDGIRGTCRYLGGRESTEFKFDEKIVQLPSFAELCNDKDALMRQTKQVECELNPWNGRKMTQNVNGRILIVEPPREPMTQEEFDQVAALPFAWHAHWSYTQKIPAYEMIKDSITVVRGCPGGCAFCGLVAHQGRQLVWRSLQSIVRSVSAMTLRSDFRGTITDIGGAAGNIYGHRPLDVEKCKTCRRVSCMHPNQCANYYADEKPLMELLDAVRQVPGVKHLFVNSGLRLDLALRQPHQTEKIIKDHVSGQLSVAPEHLDPEVLRLMRKGSAKDFDDFRQIFDRVSRQAGKKQFMVPYFISNFPGSTRRSMQMVDEYLSSSNWSLQQVQDFIPLPMTMGAAMYCSGTASDGTIIEVNRGLSERREQRDLLRRNRSGGIDKEHKPARPQGNRPPKKQY